MLKVILLFLVILLVFIGSNIYVPLRLASLFRLKRKKTIFFLFMAGTLSFPLSMFLQRSTNHWLTEFYYLISANWIGLFLYLLLLLLCFELVNLVIKIPSKAAGLTIIFLSIAISIYALANANSFEINQVEIPIKKLKKEMKIVHLSDLHIGAYRGRSYLEKIIKATNIQKPDLVLITGDLIDSHRIFDNDSLSAFKDLEAPVFFTTGNHEHYINLDRALSVIAGYNIRILRNEVIEINDIQLIGLDYMKADPDSFDMHSLNSLTIKEVIAGIGISAELPTILMHHSPVGLEYVNNCGIDLMLAGHTHSGQIFPMSLISRLFFPYNKGLYDFHGTFIYVSQGAGTFGPRMRLGTKNEIAVIKLKKI